MMSFEDVIPSTTPTYKDNHGGINECVRVMGQEIDHYERESSGGTYNPYFIMDIDEHAYIECFIDSGEKLLVLSSEVYKHASQCTIVEVASHTHAVAVRALNLPDMAQVRRYLHTGYRRSQFPRRDNNQERNHFLNTSRSVKRRTPIVAKFS
ncbi:hypothetical protein N7527_010359 [Penicillium freii]|nr:hypothetical protein N7527_010359 [Penicillium freii]